MKIITLKEYVEQKLTNGYISCSRNISDTGLLKINYVMADWWIKATNGNSYSCCPSETVFIF